MARAIPLRLLVLFGKHRSILFGSPLVSDQLVRYSEKHSLFSRF